ncbi:MAG TPA: HAMP domain-containing sensor histidine kinase [Rhizomicrobium sp.]
MAVAGHDFRNQLQIILSSYSRLGRQTLDGRERQYFELGRSAAAQLASQFDQFVDALRLCEDDRSPVISRLRIQSILASLYRDNFRLAEERNISFKVLPSRLALKSDPLLLESVLRNLTRNAFKYTCRGGRVLVGCRKRGRSVRIEIRDTGAGIPGSEIARIFDPFYRPDSKLSEGLGLGLFIVRRAANLLAHQLEVQSAHGRGSCFAVIAEACELSGDTWEQQ